jgi:poly(hydroxyalkanoate) depolymerase family esterase
LRRRRSFRRPLSLLRSLLTPAARRKTVPRLPQRPLPRTRADERPAMGRWILEESLTPDGRSYDVYLPKRRGGSARVPLVMLLHGCSQTAAEFADATRFTTVADRNGFVLVLPRQERRHHPQACWQWYQISHQQRGSGEPAKLAAILEQVTTERSRWRIDPQRVYVAGLSAGGAMALTMAATYPDLVAASGVHSAPAYRSAVHGGQALAAMRGLRPAPRPGAMAPLVVVQGTGDGVVHPRNGALVIDQWIDFHTAATGDNDPDRLGRTRSVTGHTRDGRDYTRTRWYTAHGRRVLEYWLIDGLGHAWSGGRAGGSYSDPLGPRAATLMWNFFRPHRLAGPGGSPARGAEGQAA